MFPEVGQIYWDINSRVVDFPAPVGPIIPNVSPFLIPKLRS